ncbi:MAG: ATP-binding cassette domain-containing protein, partial [Candidatus Saccharimonadaceae bacterium]
MSKSPVIKLSSVVKKFGSTKAVDNISLEIEKGEVVGIVGVNGAGKTTTIAMLLGFIRATSGDIEIFGRPMNVTVAHKFHHDIGYAAGDMEMFDKLTGQQYLDFILRANKM